MKQLALTVGLLLLVTAAVGKDKEKKSKNTFIGLGLGGAQAGFVDPIQSPRVYSGYGLLTSIAIDRYRKGYQQYTQLQFSPVTVNNGSGSRFGENPAMSYSLQVSSGWLWRIPAPLGRFKWYAGPALQTFTRININPAFGNSTLGLMAHAGVGVASRVEFPFRLRDDRELRIWFLTFKRKEHRPLVAGWECELPLAGFHARQPYAGLYNAIGNDPVGGILQSLGENTRFAGVGSYWYFRQQLYLHYYLRNGNALALGWNWNAYRLERDGLEARSAFGGIQLSLKFRLDQNKLHR